MSITPNTGPGEGLLDQLFWSATDSIPTPRFMPIDPKGMEEPGGPKDWEQYTKPKPSPTTPAPTTKKSNPDDPNDPNYYPYKDYQRKGGGL